MCWVRRRKSQLAIICHTYRERERHKEDEIEERAEDRGPLKPVERKATPVDGSRCFLASVPVERSVLSC